MSAEENPSLQLENHNLSSSSSNAESLNLTGIHGVATEDLQKLFDDDVELFFRYARTKTKRYTGKLEALDPEKCDPKELDVKKDEVLLIAHTLAIYLRFIDAAAGLSDDTINNRLVDLENEITALHGLFVVRVKDFNDKIPAIPPPGTPEFREKDNILFPFETPNFLTKRKPVMNENVKLLAEQSMCTETVSDNIESRSIAGVMNQASTPVRGNQVRFSDVVNHHTVSSCQEDDVQENSWKFVEPTTNHIEEISLVEDLQAISNILSKKIHEDLTDVEVISMEKRDCKELKSLKLNVEKKSSNLPIVCNADLKQESVKAFRAATCWIRSVEDLVHRRDLHLESDHKHVKPLELPVFQGHMDSSTNIYEFLFNYNIISRGFTETDKASYLFSNFLSESIQSEVRHIRTNFAAMRQLLLNKHGNVNTLMLHKRNQIKKLKQIIIRSTKEEKIKYVKSFCEILDQLASLVEINLKDFPCMGSEIFSYSNIMAISKLLPDFLFRLFSSGYVKETTRLDVQALSGQQSFDVLMKILKQYLKEVEFTAELFLDESLDKPEKEAKSGKGKGVFSYAGSSSKDSKDQHTGKDRIFNTEKYYGAPCIAHKDVYTKVKQCLSGNCSLFLGMNPKQRVEKAEQKNVCKLCFLHGCKKRQIDEECLFKKVIPEGIICSDCKKQNIFSNILMCSDHSNSYEEVASALSEFLPGYRKGTKVALFFLGKMNAVKKTAVDKPVRINDEVFDVDSGQTIPKSDVLFKIRKDAGLMAIYPTQTLNLKGVPVQVLWDTGALGELVKQDIAEKLQLSILDEKSQSFSVAGGQVVHTQCPLYEITLGPNDRDEYHSFPLLGVSKISGELPEVDLKEVVCRARKKLVSFPEAKEIFPEKVGGADLHLIIGTRQSHLFPTRIYVLEDGLQIWRSPLRDIYGSNIVFSGPIEPVAKAINLIDRIPTFFQEFHKAPMMADILTPLNDLEVDPSFYDINESEIEEEEGHFSVMNLMSDVFFNPAAIMKKKPCPRALEKEFDDQEVAGCTVDYRCEDCAPCKACKQSDKLRSVSIRDEAEEVLIRRSVTVDVEKKVSTCSYPFTEDPEAYLTKMWGGKTNNFEMAKAILKTQRNKPLAIRESVVKFNQEVYDKGFVAPLSELPDDLRNEIISSEFKHFFCWRSVHKADSLSTPSRLVVDPTISSFNNIIAKGPNCLTSLFQIIINWRSNKFGFVSDIKKMFNSVRLTPEMYKFSLYLFSTSLDPSEDIEIWANKTLMYGIRSASGQATCALRKTADIKEKEFPLASKIIKETTYMDDSSGSTTSKEMMDKTVEELTKLLPYGGFTLKVVTKSGEDPTENASNDGVATSFAGYKWKSKDDKMMFKCKDINFNIKRRGFKKPNKMPIINEEDVELLVEDLVLTRRNLLGKVLEMFDVLGLFEPIKVRYKIDLHKLTGADYDQSIPDNLRSRWIDNLKLMHKCRELECPRSVVHKDAIDPDHLELICCSDAATTMAGCAIYVRCRLPDGKFSVKLLTSRSKTSWGTIPRNELMSCVLVAETAFTVCKVLKDRVKRIIFVTDSAIALCWISNDSLKLKQFVHARVKHIHRLVGKQNFFLIAGVDNPADLLTRGLALFDSVKEGSSWQEGESWMYQEFEEMPIRSYEEVCSAMTPEAVTDMEKEAHPSIPAIHFAITDEEPMDDCFCINELEKDNEDLCTHEFTISNDDSSVPAVLQCCPNINIPEDQVKSNVINSVQVGKDSLNLQRYPVDFIKYGFKRAFLVLSYVVRYISKLRHKAHITKKIEYSECCGICNVKSRIGGRELGKISSRMQESECRVVCSPLDFFLAWKCICRIGTQEVKDHYGSNSAKLSKYEEHDGILYGAGRLDYPDIRIETNPPMYELDFNQPVFLNSSVITYSVIMFIHWDENVCAHAGVGRTMNFVLKLIHVSNVRKVVKYVRETCMRCRYLLKKHYLPLSCNQSVYSLLQAPPFFSCMIDVAGNFTAYDSIKKRVSKPAYFLVQVCMCTGATSIGVLEDLSVRSIILALTRTADRYGWSKYLLLDNQSSFKALKDANICFKDLAGKLWTKQKMILDFSTPHSHHEHGRVESKVKVVKEYLDVSGELTQKHTYVELETIGLNISAVINGLPICTNSDDTSNTVGELNLITPNLFLLGRNNARAPEKFVTMETNPGKALKQLGETNQKLMDLLGNYVHRFIPGKKFSDVHPPEINDVVLFLYKESSRSRNIVYKYGRVVETCLEGRINKVLIEYRNADEVVMRQVPRNIKDLVLILGCEEIGFNTREHHLASWVQRKYL